MAIKVLREPPAAGKATVRRALDDLDPRRGTRGGSLTDISEPLPVFRLGFADLSEPDILDRAEFVAWRYLVEGDGSATAMADVGEDKGGGPVFASLARNEQADFLLAAAHLAQSEADAAAQDCEIRILLVPALYASALWLTTAPPVFVPFLDVARPIRQASDVKVRPDFLSGLVARARDRPGPRHEASPSMSGP